MKLYLLLAMFTATLHTTKEIRNLQGKLVPEKSVCTGVVISPNEVLTAGHCAEGAKAVLILIAGHIYTGQIEYLSPKSDLAVIQIVTKQPLKARVQLGNTPFITERVYSFNSGDGYLGTYGEGFIQNITPFDETTKDMIMSSIGVKHGASGSGLFDDQGRLIGITTLTDPPYSWAVPLSEIKECIQDAHAIKAH